MGVEIRNSPRERFGSEFVSATQTHKVTMGQKRGMLKVIRKNLISKTYVRAQHVADGVLYICSHQQFWRGHTRASVRRMMVRCLRLLICGSGSFDNPSHALGRPAPLSADLYRFTPHPSDDVHGACGECAVSGMNGRCIAGSCKVCVHHE